MAAHLTTTMHPAPTPLRDPEARTHHLDLSEIAFNQTLSDGLRVINRTKTAISPLFRSLTLYFFSASGGYGSPLF